MSEITCVVNVDTKQPMSALNTLQQRIEASVDSLEALNELFVELAKKTPWYRRLTIIQGVTLVILFMTLASNAWTYRRVIATQDRCIEIQESIRRQLEAE